jgi:signal transduction histidine kinase
MVTASPLSLNGEKYYILSLSDLSDEKRRILLERVFIHDVVNIAGGLKNIINMMKTPGQISPDIDLLQMADVSTSSLLEEIEAHSSIISAENGHLEVLYQETQTADMLLGIFQILARNDAAVTKKISVSENSENIIFSTDKVLLRRILVNLTKNALEASNEGDIVTIGCHRAGTDVEFTVNNNGVIPEDIQMQIFQRSFSTKGVSRGIGTYSIKLFTERYLKGTVHFISNEATGTTFYVRYPINPK